MKITTTLIGSIVGFVVFMALGLIPSMHYGGYAGLLLAQGTFGIEGIAGRALVVFGMALGVFAVGSLFAVLGAVTGAAVGVLTTFRKLADIR